MNQQQLTAWRRVLGESAPTDDDPTFQPLEVIAEQQRVSEKTIRRYIKAHPEQIEKKLVRRSGHRYPRWVYRLKDAA